MPEIRHVWTLTLLDPAAGGGVLPQVCRLARRVVLTVGLPACLGSASVAFAQDGAVNGAVNGEESQLESDEALAEDLPTEEALKIDFSVLGSIQYRLRDDLSWGGSVAITRAGGTVTVGSRLSEMWALSVHGSYEFSMYDFSGGRTFHQNGGPWENINTTEFRANLTWHDDDTPWSVFGGPAVQFANESGADWDDGVSGGGFIGATHRMSDSLILGAGVGVTTQIEDDVQVFPIFIVEWLIVDQLRLSTNITRSLAKRNGAELIWTPIDRWEFAIGAAYENRRFRLDDVGFAPDGVGEDQYFPIWGRVSYRFNPNWEVNLFGGLNAFGEMSIEDEDGRTIEDGDYDSAPFVAATVQVRF